MGVIIAQESRPDAFDHAARLAELGSATIGESGGAALDRRIKPAWPGARLAGPAYTVTCAAGDNLALHVAVANAPIGSVLAVDVGRIAARGYFGEVLATAAEAAGIVGLVIDGCVRDIAALADHGFAVFAHGACIPGATKTGPGVIGADAVVGGVSVQTGDWLVGDEDGVAVVAAEQIDAVIAAAAARAAKERDMFLRLRHGATTPELLNLDPASIVVHNAPAVPNDRAVSAAAARYEEAGIVSTPNAPVPSGGYSQARAGGDLLFLAGVGPYDPVTREVVGDDIAAQTEQAMANAGAVLAAAGLNFSAVVSASVFLAELDRDWETFDEVYRRYLTPPYPARAVIGAGLKEILVEIVMTASRRG
jgi:4-hydroxy-4-methyl-2-oxoglutarate aldolase